MNAVDDGVDLVALELVLYAMREEGVASLVFDFHDTFLGVTRYLDTLDIGKVDDLLHERAGFRDNVLKTSHIDLVDDK